MTLQMTAIWLPRNATLLPTNATEPPTNAIKLQRPVTERQKLARNLPTLPPRQSKRRAKALHRVTADPQRQIDA
jgi:hypothetical protein